MTDRRISDETRAAIERLLRAGTPNRAIARQLGVHHVTVARIRTAIGLPRHRSGRPSYATLEAAFWARTEQAEDGHLRWTGPISGGLPAFWHEGQQYSAYRIAFTLRTGREPEGKTKPECGRKHCVAPEHVDDTATRQRDRAALAAITRRRQTSTHCANGHDFATHGRRLADGRRYCNACLRGREKGAP